MSRTPRALPGGDGEPGVERLLRQSQIANPKPVHWGSNGVWCVDLMVDRRPVGRAIYKPRSGETPLWDFPDGTLYRREYAAYLTAAALGWTFVPATVIRDGPRGIGTVQPFVDHERRATFADLRRDHERDLARMALFDYLTNNADRKSAHCLLSHDGQLFGIDHGLTFHRDLKIRTVLSDFFDRPIARDLLGQLRRWLADPAKPQRLRDRLDQLLDRAEVAGLFERLQGVTATGRLPGVRIRSYWYWG